jgi:4-hydroxybenzoate polyprenyltransferase
MRPKQWTKNAFVLAPLIFARKAGDPAALAQALAATGAFCLASSAGYLVNDLIDRGADRNHPLKSRRPIISGSLPPTAATAAAILLSIAAVIVGLAVSPPLAGMVGLYLLLSLAYSLVLKQVVIIDVMTIATGFVLRVAGGAAAIRVDVSSWLFLCTILLALFLGFGKRRHELVLLEKQAGRHRAILRDYSPYFLDQMMSVVTASTVVAYSLYTISPDVTGKLGTPRLYLTIPFVLYGIFRYLYLIHQRDEGGSPSSILLNDRPLLVNIVLWVATVVGMIYFPG